MIEVCIKQNVDEDKNAIAGVHTVTEQRIKLDDEELKQHKNAKQEILGTVLSCSIGAGEDSALFAGRKSPGLE